MSRFATAAKSKNPVKAQAFAMPLDQIDVNKPRLFVDDSIGFHLERLRQEDPAGGDPHLGASFADVSVKCDHY